MIFDLHRNFVFIHMPRTGGMSITAAVARAGDSATIDVFSGRHASAAEVLATIVADTRVARRQIDPDAWWSAAYCFAVVRSPWEVLASTWRLACRDAARITWDTRLHCSPEWYDYIRHVRSGTFADFVREECAQCKPHGGYWRQYCGVDQVTPILFADLPSRWPEICRGIGIDSAPLPHDNHADHAPPPWTSDLIDLVADACRTDIALFGFPPPK